MTVREFIEKYDGFDWENGEVVLVNHSNSSTYICKALNGGLNINGVSMWIDEMWILDWKHTDSTMVISVYIR